MRNREDGDLFRIRGMYFSGTGTTEKVVKSLALKIADNLKSEDFTKEEDIDFTPAFARERGYSFGREDILIFGLPVIAGRVPNVLLKFLSSLEGGGGMAVPVVLYGNRNYDDGLIELRNILTSRGFNVIGGAAFIGEHSFSRILAAGRPDDVDMEVAQSFAISLADKIRMIVGSSGGDLDRLESILKIQCPVYVKGEDPVRDYYKPRDREGKHINILKVKPKLRKELCTGCGICAKVCPMGSIKETNLGVVEGICIKCCGCEKKCPEGAIYFDDPGYIYHKEELEYLYAKERKEPELFI